jgi:hypothetical protein
MWTSFLERVIRLSGGTRAGGPPSTAAGSPRRSHLPNQHSRPARTEAATSAAMRDLRKRRRPYTAAATANSTMSCTSSRSHLPAMTRPPRPTSRPRKPRVRPRRERSDVSNATPPGASTTSSHYLPRPPAEPRHDRLNPCPPQRARSEPGGDVDRYVSERLEAPAYTQSPRLSSPVEAPCPRMLRDPDKHASDSFIGFALPGTPNSDSYTCGAARDCRVARRVGNLADSAASTARSSIRAARAQRSPRQAPSGSPTAAKSSWQRSSDCWRGWYSTGLRPRRSTGSVAELEDNLRVPGVGAHIPSSGVTGRHAPRRPPSRSTHAPRRGDRRVFDTLAERLEPGEGLGPGPIPLGAASAAAR